MTDPMHSHNEGYNPDHDISQNAIPPITPTNNFMGYAYNFAGDYPIYDLSQNYASFPGYYPPLSAPESYIGPTTPHPHYIRADMHYNLHAQSQLGYNDFEYGSYPAAEIPAGYPQFTPTFSGTHYNMMPPAGYTTPQGQIMSPDAQSHPFAHKLAAPEKVFTKKTWQIIAGLGAGIIIILAVVLIPNAIGRFSTGQDAEREQQAVKNYFLALSEGDAPRALALSHSKPASTEFLSSDILEQQMSQEPISDITVEKPADPNLNLVKYSISINGKIIHNELKVIKQADGTYQLDKGYATLSINNKDHQSGLTLFGKPVQNTDQITVFPGVLDFGSLSDFVHFSVANPQWNTNYDFAEISSPHSTDIQLNLHPELTFLGKAQVMRLIISNIIFCSHADAVAQHCPTVFVQQGDTEKLRLNEPEYAITDSGKTSLGIIPFHVDIDYTYSSKGVDHTSKVTLKGVVNSLAHGTSLSLAWDE